MIYRYFFIIVVCCQLSSPLFAGGKPKSDDGKAKGVELIHPEINNPNRHFIVLKTIDMSILKGDRSCRHVSILLLLELNNAKNKDLFKGKLQHIQSIYRDFLMQSLSCLTKIDKATDYITRRLKEQSTAYFGGGVVKDVIVRKMIVRGV